MKTEIVIADVVKGTSTNAEAVPLFILLDKAISSNKSVILSLKNCPPLSSSFLNSSIGELFDKYGASALKGKLSIKDYTPTVANSIKNYINSVREIA
ncbi:MAG: STAS-like domain-containing protein [Bacteroidetes bacterium]|nr:STAS-like domain-containing protein [Bacteroidota bacterium]